MTAGPRGIDHLVLAVSDLDAAAAAYERLGFTVAARGVHPWGTWNRLVQFEEHSFFELLTVGEPERIEEPRPGYFSFGAFNRDFLEGGEGMSMLSLRSRDASADLADFLASGLATFAPFRFERIAKGPDGIERQVAFKLTFTADPALPRVGAFTTEHEFPENLWRAELQSHANGATGIESVTLVATDPAAHRRFLSGVTGCREPAEAGDGMAFALDGARLDVLTPESFAGRFGIEAHPAAAAHFAAVTIRARDLERVSAELARAEVPTHRHGELIVAGAVHGLVIAFRGMA